MKNNLKELRKSQNLLQKDIAKMLGIANNTYCGYENSIHEPPIEILFSLAEIYDCTIDELFGRTNNCNLFEDARVEQSEIIRLYKQMSPEAKSNLVNYARGLVAGCKIGKSSSADNKN